MADVGGDFRILSKVCMEYKLAAKGTVEVAVKKMHATGFVHGDLRDTNILCRRAVGGMEKERRNIR